MRDSAAISIAALIAMPSATTLDPITHWSARAATGNAGAFRLHSHDTGAALSLTIDAGADGSVDAYEG